MLPFEILEIYAPKITGHDKRTFHSLGENLLLENFCDGNRKSVAQQQHT